MRLSLRIHRFSPANLRRPRLGAVASALIVLGLLSTTAGSALAKPMRSDASEGSEAKPRDRAVAAPNLRVGVHYGYLDLGDIDTYAAATNATLSGDEQSGHSGRIEIVGTVPIMRSVGLRVGLRGDMGERQRSLDGLSRGNNEISSYGAMAALLLRDPEVGSIEVGGGYDRLGRDGPIDAEEFSGSGAISIFYPDLGLGPVDWLVRFDFTHRYVTGINGPVDYDGDRYVVSGQAGWYASPDLQIAFGGRWVRAEHEFSSEDDREGFVQVRWWLRNSLPVALPVELTFGGSAGMSEYKQTPFRGDGRPIYRANVGLVFRYGSGDSLVDVIRRFD